MEKRRRVRKMTTYSKKNEKITNLATFRKIKTAYAVVSIPTDKSCWTCRYEPKEEHLIQVNIYMFCTGIGKACLLYECKDDQALKEFYVKQDRNILDPILDKIRYVQGCLKKGKEP